MNDYKSFLADCIWAFHVSIVLFVLIAPFTNILALLVIHVAFCVTLLVHWWFNSNVCSLSVIEANLRSVPYTDSWTHQFIAPVYEINKTTWSHIAWGITILLMLVSVHKIYTSDKWKSFVECFSRVSNSDDSNFVKMNGFAECFKILFVVTM